MTHTLRVALLGCGRMGTIRARWVRAAGALVSCTFDVDRERAAALAGGTARVLERVDQLPLAELDAVFVCTPPDERGSVESACVAAGVPFFVEKPLARHLDDVAPLVRAVRESGLVTGVGYMNRQRHSVERARAFAASGTVLSIVAQWAGGRYQRDWWLDPTRSGGPFNEQGTHLVDLVRHIGGEVVEVASLPRREHSDDATAATLRLASGAIATLVHSCASNTKSIGLSVVTTDGAHRLDGWDFDDGVDPPEVDRDAVFGRETDAFLAAVRAKDPSLVRSDVLDAARTQAVVDAILESARCAAPVRLTV